MIQPIPPNAHTAQIPSGPTEARATPLDPLALGHGPALRNRLMLAPMTNCQSHPDGTLSEEEHRWLTMRAHGGFGLTMTCSTHVQPAGQGFTGQLGIFSDVHVPGLTRLATDLNAADTVSYIQLHHAGMRSPADLITTQAVCPSDTPKYHARALTTEEVEDVVQAFVAAATRAQTAGFHGVEVHAAHGYLIGQFLSPEINRRHDRYGGSLENRSRLLFDVISGIRSACGPGLGLAVRLSSDRFGIVTEEMVEVFERLVNEGGIDLIDMSLWDVQRAAKDGAFEGQSLLDVFANIQRRDVRLGAAGNIHAATDISEVLARGADVAILGRAGIIHHDYPLRLAADPTFRPLQPPVEPAILEREGVSPAFLAYLRSSFGGFVAEADPDEVAPSA